MSDGVDPPGEPPSSVGHARGGVLEVVAAFTRLGCTSFGGPVAHLGYFRAELVEKRRWIDEAHYAELVALCQFLPGPASSQIVFALGMQRAGFAGAIAASLCFLLPSAVLMIAFAYGIAVLGDVRGAGWLHGLKLAAVAVVAQAVWAMGRTLCPDRARRSICVAAAAVLLAAPGAVAQLGVLVGGAALGWWRYRDEAAAPARPAAPARRRRAFAAVALLAFLALLIALPALALATKSRAVEELDSFYRSGALVFGGGHVVLPLLHADVVPTGWLGDDRFLAGYAAAQAVPGPMFSFAAYLGTAMSSGPYAWLAGLRSLFAIFLPAWLLIGGALPFWDDVRSKRWARAALAGANAAVVGVLLAALYDPVLVEGVRGPLDLAAALVAFALLEHWKAPAWSIVLAMAGAGQWILP